MGSPAGEAVPMGGDTGFIHVQTALEAARRERADALARVREYARTGRLDRVLPFLMANMAAHPSIRGIRLWQLDSMMFGRSRRSAQTTIRRMRELVGDDSTVKDGYTTIGWALESQEKSVRMSTWLYLLLLREHMCVFDLPDGFPYGLLFDDAGGSGGKELDE